MIIHSLFKNAVESVTPDPESKDKFYVDGTLSPEQFTHCGNMLVQQFSSWYWDGGEPDKRWSFLPENKQFLVSRNVKSIKVFDRQIYKEHIVNETQVEDEWTYTKHENIKTVTKSNTIEKKESESDDEYLDIEDEDDCKIEDNIDQLSRSYDIYITYDKYYRTPRVWLFGYNYDGMPLGYKEMVDDIESDYLNKTVTYDSHPHLSLKLISIHPCKHASVMKNLMIRHNKKIDLDEYFFVFLKFISSIIPNINYDHTKDI